MSLDRKRAFSGSTGKLNYELQATPYIKDTWHELPMTDSSSGISDGTEVSNWMELKDRLPKFSAKGPANVVPSDLSDGYAKDMMPQGVRVSFSKHDKNYENFLAGPQLVKEDKMNIEGSFCQGPNHIKVNVDRNIVKSEKFARSGLRESYGVTFMLELLSERLEKALKPDSGWDAHSELKLVHEWLELVKLTSFRTGAFLQAIQVLTKDSLRNEALENLWGSYETKELRHSHYATPRIFGPLSAKFEPFVLPSSHSHRSYLLYPMKGFNSKNRGFSGSTFNHSNEAGYSGQQKRAASSYWDTPRNKRVRQSSGYTKSIAPQEVLRRSETNSGKQQRFFQENQRKGKRKFQNSGKGSRR